MSIPALSHFVRCPIATWLGSAAFATAQQSVRITEFMASNTAGVEDNFRQKSERAETLRMSKNVKV
jgi:hypothetical protein